jgi:metallo-beta-lactamase family protein
MSKRKDKINQVMVEFIGNNTIDVTGSMIYVKFYDKALDKHIQILLDAGGVQGYSVAECYSANVKMLEKIDAKNLDFILISHQNLDHISLIPAFVANGFTGRIIMTKEAYHLGIPLLMDSAFINGKEVEWLKKNKKTKDKVYKPLYQASDVEETKNYIDKFPLNEIINITPNIAVKLIPNVHLLGACSIECYCKDINSRIHKLFYSGDIGNVSYEKHFVYDTQYPPKNAGLSIIESTYGARSKIAFNKNLRKQELKLLEDTIIDTIINKKGSVLIPTFSLDRTENIIYNLKRIIENNEKLSTIKVVLDGKLSNNLLDIYEKICENKNKEEIDEIINWDNLIRIRDYQNTVKMLDETDGKIIVSSSGFCTGGRVLSYLKKLLPYKKNTIIFCGFSSEGSPAFKIKHKNQTGQKTIKIDNDVTLMNSDVVTLNSFSSHIQHDSLIDYTLQINTDIVVLVHGELNGREELKEDLEKMYEDKCESTKVIIPKKNQVIYF